MREGHIAKVVDLLFSFFIFRYLKVTGVEGTIYSGRQVNRSYKSGSCLRDPNILFVFLFFFFFFFFSTFFPLHSRVPSREYKHTIHTNARKRIPLSYSCIILHARFCKSSLAWLIALKQHPPFYFIPCFVLLFSPVLFFFYYNSCTLANSFFFSWFQP